MEYLHFPISYVYVCFYIHAFYNIYIHKPTYICICLSIFLNAFIIVSVPLSLAHLLIIPQSGTHTHTHVTPHTRVCICMPISIHGKVYVDTYILFFTPKYWYIHYEM